ncbi:MAG: STAS domain-containing protein [Algisphaera sp.]
MHHTADIIEQEGDRVVVRLAEREVNTDDLREVILGLKTRLDDGARTFIFCFGKVEFLPSACLALLLMFYQDAKKHEARIVLLNCQENVSFLMKLARLDTLFDLAHGEPAEA